MTKAWVDYDADTTGTVVPPADWLCIAGQPIPDAAYIAAMSPDVALALIARVQKAEAERAENVALRAVEVAARECLLPEAVGLSNAIGMDWRPDWRDSRLIDALAALDATRGALLPKATT